MIIKTESWVATRLAVELPTQHIEIVRKGVQPKKDWVFCVESPDMCLYYNLGIDAFVKIKEYIQSIDK